jgi:(p)ppGpp synthase/HD superfamily hydrolase
MEKFTTLQDAVALAEFAHRNQRDKAGMPYVDHPKRVLAAVQGQGAQPYVQMAAVLHDVVEDTPFTTADLLRLGFSNPVVRLVDLLTRRDHIPVEEYYQFIGENEDATMIKLADIADNTQPWRLVYLDQETQDRLRKKYDKARKLIREARCTCSDDDRLFNTHRLPCPLWAGGGMLNC